MSSIVLKGTSIVLNGAVRIPPISDLESFRRWARSDEFPDHGWYSYMNGDLWVDDSMERAVHNLIKNKIAAVLTLLAEQTVEGTYFADRMLLTHPEAALSTEPDGMFASDESIESGKARLEEGMDSLELIGSPDMTLEVVSPTSEEKDIVVLRDLYWRAGVREYWLVDSREEVPALEILRHTARGYVTTRQQGGWVKSAVFGKSFRLHQSISAIGLTKFKLEVR